MVALYWIKGEDKEWKQFMHNGAQEIRRLVPVSHWLHCPGKENPADMASHGVLLIWLLKYDNPVVDWTVSVDHKEKAELDWIADC